ncbi:MAG: response regulator transcription factor [Campylobacterota bacterium]|nr:response regulator transcription factor [Campylobacterota bacterium]
MTIPYSVSNGQDAFDTYKEQQPDILLLDINMPKLNGLEVAKKIRLDDKITRIIILTAHVEQDKLLFAAELNLTKYLPKPISRSELKDALNDAIAQLQDLKGKKELVYLNEEYSWNKQSQKLLYLYNEVKLTKYEILLLSLLASKKDKIFSLDEISIELWNNLDEVEVNTQKLKDIIKRLRKKLPSNAIENIYGAGYKLNYS